MLKRILTDAQELPVKGGGCSLSNFSIFREAVILKPAQ